MLLPAVEQMAPVWAPGSKVSQITQLSTIALPVAVRSTDPAG